MRAATPPTAEEKQNAGITELTAGFTPDTADTRLAILFTPVGDHWPANLPAPDLVPLSRW
jgi:hypothetical protein